MHDRGSNGARGWFDAEGESTSPATDDGVVVVVVVGAVVLVAPTAAVVDVVVCDGGGFTEKSDPVTTVTVEPAVTGPRAMATAPDIDLATLDASASYRGFA